MRSGIPTRAFAANDNQGHACWTASRPRQALHIDGELPASTMREGAAMVLAGIESGEPGPGTLKIVTPPDMQERPIPYLATVKGLVASPVVDSSAKSPRPTSSSRYWPPRMREARGESWNCFRNSSAVIALLCLNDCRLKRGGASSGLVAATVFACQTKRAAQSIEEAVPILGCTRFPILFRGRERKSEQIGRSKKPVAAHSQTECGALEESWRRIARPGEPRTNAGGQPSGTGISL